MILAEVHETNIKHDHNSYIVKGGIDYLQKLEKSEVAPLLESAKRHGKAAFQYVDDARNVHDMDLRYDSGEYKLVKRNSY